MFPLVNLRGCFFHLFQNIFKKVQANNLRNIYNDPNDDTFLINNRMISALAFVQLKGGSALVFDIEGGVSASKMRTNKKNRIKKY